MRIDKKMLDDIPAWLEKQEDIPSGWLYIGDEKERYLLAFDYACECRDGDIW